MNGSNHDSQQRDVIDDIATAVARITDDQVEDRLRETLRRAGREPRRDMSSNQAEAGSVKR